MEEKKGKLSKKWFISEIAKRARFTQSDIAIVVDTIEDILKDIVRNREVFVWAGIFKMSVRTVKARKRNNVALNIPMLFPETERVAFTSSNLWKELLKEEEETE